MRILITGGAGFIGSAVIRHLLLNTNHQVINIDKLTYAGNLESLKQIEKSKKYFLEVFDICNRQLLEKAFNKYKPQIVMHLAAESHVDRSVDNPNDFIQSNIVGTFQLLEVSRKFWNSLDSVKRKEFRFHHISTDEVYGDLRNSESLFTEDTPYNPSSPYSASKASADHLVRAWHRTYELPTVITNCSNNYGPFHFPEKLIPLMIIKSIQGNNLPVYGNGNQIRDWLYVEDHAKALIKVAMRGFVGETYNIGGKSAISNIEVVKSICHLLDELSPNHPKGISSYDELITHVDDRPGHDLKYAIDTSKIESELGWSPEETFDTGLRKTIDWYLKNKHWWHKIINKNYDGSRLGIIKNIKSND